MRTNLRMLEGALDVWRARGRDAPNRAAKLAEEERDWSRREEAANAAALALIRTLVPPDIKGDTVEGLRHRAARVVAQAAAQAKRRKRSELCGNPPTPSSVTDSHTGEAEGDTTEEPPVSDKSTGDCGGLGRLLHLRSRREIEECETSPLGPGAP